MKKSIRTKIYKTLAVFAFVFGVTLFAPISTFAVDCAVDSTNPVCPGGLTTGSTAANTAGGPTKLFGEGSVLTTIINFALYFIGAVSVLMLIIGGVRYTMSGGNEKAVGAAKSTILYAVIGVVVALLAYAIVNFVLTTL